MRKKVLQKRKRIFIGLAWPYVNGDIHPGHIAGNFLPADIFARFQRYLGNEVLLVSGADCYGTPITIEADKRKISPKEVIDEYYPNHLKLFELYGISFDWYTKTTTKNHKQVVKEMLINLAKNGYLLKKKTYQFYSEQDNKFLPDRYVEGECGFCGYKESRSDQCDQCGQVLNINDLKNPISKLTKAKVTLKQTEHLFINWPKLQTFSEKYIKSKKDYWKPWIYKEAMGWLKNGLKERAITRDLTWGIEIPNKQLPKELQLDNIENKRIYVWFEAVIGYLSAAREWGKNWKEFWYPKKQEDVVMYNFMGKDNLVFHSLFWPGQLWGAYKDRVKLPDIISANQYLNIEGKKFSKSRGITIDSIYLAQTYGVDPVRFYLTYIMPETGDADFSWQGFVDVTNNVLIGSMGNYINRVLTLSKELTFSKAKIDSEVKKNLTKIDECKELLNKCEFKLYCQKILELADFGNKYIDKQSPWKLDKNSQEYQSILANGLLIILGLLLVIKPLIPTTVDKLAKMLGVEIEEWPDKEIIEFLKELLTKVKITNPAPLFAKIDPEVVEEERRKIKKDDILA